MVSGSFVVRAFNGLVIALVALLLTQIGHEGVHAISGVLLGEELRVFNLFAVDFIDFNAIPEDVLLIVAGSAAAVNILVGIACVLLFRTSWAKTNPSLRLFIMYLGAYNLFTGFGYLFMDPLLYNPDAASYGDWRQIIHILGGGWEVRLPILLVGALGILFGFYWLANSVNQFGEGMTDPKQRVRLNLPLLIVPYVVINVLFTVLSFWHPLGADGVIITIFQYWLGYIGFFWAFFIASIWTEIKEPIRGSSMLPGRVLVAWAAVAIVGMGLSVAVLLPGIDINTTMLAKQLIRM